MHSNTQPNATAHASSARLEKSPTGIEGLDNITFGGLPKGRCSLVCGGAGCGKTVLAMEFLVRGAIDFDEPGVCLSFEETSDELIANTASLGFDIAELIASKKLLIDHIQLERNLIDEAGEYDLEALFVRLAHAVESVGAKRVVLDSVEALFAGLANESVLRAELRRLFRWIKTHGLTAVVTAERGEGLFTRYGLEEYISDCVILLDTQVSDTVLTRRLRIVKYRGSGHGPNEYPFLVDEQGISVLPLTSLDLNHPASQERVSTGIPALDDMLTGNGYFRGSSILVSGTSGTGKTSISAHFIAAACARGERSVFFSFEESPAQITRNMRSIGIDLQPWVDRGMLHLHAARPTTFGLETHLVRIHKVVSEVNPSIVAIDPITALLHSGTESQTSSMLLRLVDYLKSRQITSLMTTLTSPEALEQTDVDISSLVDTWILLRDIESGSERNRGLHILKSRGSSHSNQIREFLLTDHGIDLRDIYPGDAGLLTGSARAAREFREEGEAASAKEKIERIQSMLQRKRKVLEAQMASIRLELEAQELESHQLIEQEHAKLNRSEHDRLRMATTRRFPELLSDGKTKEALNPESER